jgi:hypothetical protein
MDPPVSGGLSCSKGKVGEGFSPRIKVTNPTGFSPGGKPAP